MKIDKTIYTVNISRSQQGEFLHTMFFKRATNDKVPLFKKSTHGYGNFDETIKEIVEKGGRLVSYETADDGTVICVYLFKDHYAVIIGFDSHINMTVCGFDEKFITDLLNKISSDMVETPPKGSVMMLVSDSSGLYLTELGEIDCPLERSNYSETIITQYDNVVEDLKTKTPSGRLTVLDGLPGTGKSFFIRGLISEVDALFIYVPASIGGRLTGPDVIPVFLREREKDVPIVLIMEDADATVATRQIDNVGKLSDLLNMSDGILGEMADIRIIATTNAKKTEIDEAVLRVGRTNEHIHFKHLEKAHAISVFTRLTGVEDEDHDGHRLIRGKQDNHNTIGEIYKIARNYGWKPNKDNMMKSKSRKNNWRRLMSISAAASNY